MFRPCLCTTRLMPMPAQDGPSAHKSFPVGSSYRRRWTAQPDLQNQLPAGAWFASSQPCVASKLPTESAGIKPEHGVTLFLYMAQTPRDELLKLREAAQILG